MEWFDRAKEIKKDNSTATNATITEQLNQEGYDINYETVRKRFYRESQRQTNMLGLSKNETPKEEPKFAGSKKGKEERKPTIDDMGEYYNVSDANGFMNIKITKDQLREFKLLYCEQKATLNFCSYKLNIPREQLYLIKTAFTITKDDVPYIDEDLKTKSTEELIEETLERKKYHYQVQLQQQEIRTLKKEVEQYRKKDYFINKIHETVTEHFKDTKITPVKALPRVNNGLMLEVPLVDVHLDKLADSFEVGEDYNHEIAEQRFAEVINDVLQNIGDRKFEKIIYPLGNDFFSTDTKDGKTTKGTQQDVSLRPHKSFSKGIELHIKAIEALSKLGPVEVFNIPGNHDMMKSYYATMYLSAWFKDNENVIVDISPQTRKYIEFGKCLIGFTHGNQEKNRIFGNMQVEQSEAWGRTKYREWHTGHLHSDQVKEMHGVKVRHLPSVTGTDAWHFENGYVGAIASCQCFIWDKEKGLKEVLISTIER